MLCSCCITLRLLPFVLCSYIQQLVLFATKYLYKLPFGTLYEHLFATKFAEYTALTNEGLKMKIDIRYLQPLNLYTEQELKYIMDEAKINIDKLVATKDTDNGTLEAYETYRDIQLDASMELQNRVGAKANKLHTRDCKTLQERINAIDLPTYKDEMRSRS